MFVPCIILNQKKQPSLLPQKSCFDLHICFNPWKHHPQYFQRLGTWFHWVAESIQVPLWWDYLTWSTFSYKFFGRWEEVCDLHPPFLQEKHWLFFCKNAKKNECEVIDFCEAGVMVAKMNHECWNWTLRIFFGWPVAPSWIYQERMTIACCVQLSQNMIYSKWPWSLEEK